MNLLSRFDATLAAHQISLKRTTTRVLQINLGKKCNQTCAHCHVNAGPARREIMTRETMERILAWLDGTEISIIDITGGAPELNPHFRFLVNKVKFGRTFLGAPRHVMDRCNLTVLWEDGQQDTANFLAQHRVEIVASLPCYSLENVDAQRGDGTFEKSIRALQQLNELGYARNPALKLNLVYNPSGASLPGAQSELEAIYKTELRANFGIEFNHLFCLANLPISRFANQLRRDGETEKYAQILLENFNPHSVSGLMCRDTISVGWRGEVYDCDFNQMLEMQWRADKPQFLWDIDANHLNGRAIATANHCFGCTAGAGSSCGGATT